MSNSRVVFYFILKEKIVLKSHLMKSNHTVLRKNKVHIYGAPVLHLIIVAKLSEGTILATYHDLT
jgi:hypothetical protein